MKTLFATLAYSMVMILFLLFSATNVHAQQLPDEGKEKTDQAKLTTITVATKTGITTFCSNYNLQELVGTPIGGTWDGPAGAIKYDKFFDPSIVGSIETTYDLIYSFTDQHGVTESETLLVTVRPAPEVIIDKTANNLCYPAQFSISSSYTHADGIQWYTNPDSASGMYIASDTHSMVEYLPHSSDLNRLYFWLNIKTRHPDNVCAPAFDSIKVNISAIPSATFYADTIEGDKPLNVHFFDSSSISVGNITGWEWNFGDGQTSNLQNPSHIYYFSGYYDISLRVITNAQCQDSQIVSKYIHVLGNTSIKEAEESKIVVYPNPTDKELIIKFVNSNMLINSVSLLNLEGKILDRYVANSQSEIHIQAINQPSGFYFLKIESENGNSYYRKIMLE